MIFGSVSYRQTWRNHDNLLRLTVDSKNSWHLARTLACCHILVCFVFSVWYAWFAKHPAVVLVNRQSTVVTRTVSDRPSISQKFGDPPKLFLLHSPNLARVRNIHIGLAASGRLQLDLMLVSLKCDYSITTQPLCTTSTIFESSFHVI